MTKIFGLHMIFALLMQAFGLQTGKKDGASLASSAGVSPLAGCDGIECVKAYIDMPDPSFSWYDTHVRLSGVDEKTHQSWTGYVLNMTSQNWTTGANVKFPLWWHVLVVVIPSNLEAADWANVIFEAGVNIEDVRAVEHVSPRRSSSEKDIEYHGHVIRDHLQIDGNNLMERIPDLRKGVRKAAYLATHTRSVSASLFSALNDYEVFPDDEMHMERTDDWIKGYTWEDFMKHGGNEPERIMELPVARAGARALDAVAAFTAQLPSGEVSRFGLTGYSKYGTIVWMLGAIGDARIKAIAPIAMTPDFQGVASILRAGLTGFSLLANASFVRSAHATAVVPELVGRDYSVDFHPTFPEAAGYKVNPYAGLGEAAFQHLSEAAKLWRIIDPLYYLHRITVPTYYVMDTNDEWFGQQNGMIGDWWPSLTCPKSFLMVEAEHENAIVESLPNLAAFFRGQIIGEAMPQMDFRKTPSSIEATQKSAHTPLSLRLHYGKSCAQANEPSFLQSSFYRGGELNKIAEKKWTANLKAPEVMSFKGFAADCEGQLGPRGEFVVAEYEGPQPGIDNYKISSFFFVE